MDFGELVLVLGDLYIPTRASSIPTKLVELLIPGKMAHTLCVGNVGNAADTLIYLQSIAKHTHVVRGSTELHAPVSTADNTVVTIGGFRLLLSASPAVALHHSDGDSVDQELALAELHKHNADIYVLGGQEYTSVIDLPEQKLLIAPGSLTGAASQRALPSFLLLALKGGRVVVYVYELKDDGTLDISKSEHSKPQ